MLGFEDPDAPSSLERIIEACGGEAVDYPAKLKCCGFPIIQAREETALGELIQPIEQAMEAGADAMVTPCPLCHLSLDAWQSKLQATTGRDFAMPILHLSQLIGVAAGLPDSELKFKRHVVSVEPVAREARSAAWPDAVVSPDVVARYARDAAREVDGVARDRRRRAQGHPRRRRRDRAAPRAAMGRLDPRGRRGRAARASPTISSG